MSGRKQAWEDIAKGKGVPRRPVLHPTLGHAGQNAPKKVLRALSGPEGDVQETVRRFGRATRRQPVEHMGLIHPLSGRLMGMSRGHEVAVAGPVTGGTRTQRRLMQIAEHHGNKTWEHIDDDEKLAEHHARIAQRAVEAATHTGNAAGPRPIAIHNHPQFHGGGTRHMPSSLDLGASAQMRTQNKVVSLKPHTRRGEAKTQVTSFGHHGEPGRKSQATFERMQQHDTETTPHGLTHALRSGKIKPVLPVQARQMGVSHADRAEAHRETGEMVSDTIMEARRHQTTRAQIARTSGRKPAHVKLARARGALKGSDYDTKIREMTKPKRRLPAASRGRKAGGTKPFTGFYSREETMKRYTGGRRVAPSNVGKRLVDEERHTSLPRLLAAGTGMGAIAWGGSRFRTLGRGLRLGASHPDIDQGLRRAFHAAEVARAHTESATTPLGRMAGRGYGHLPLPVKRSLDNVPPNLRPATSALVGAIMVDQARPVRRTTYRPVV